MVDKIVSGGQTGVDMAALDVAMASGIPCGGWCPQGRIHEKGRIPAEYPLQEIRGDFKTEQENYDARTKKNIEDSDGTLVLIPKMSLLPHIKDGTRLTIQEAKDKAKPRLEIDLSQPSAQNIEAIVKWIKAHHIKVLNIGGPRESSCPGVYQSTTQFLEQLFPQLGYHPRYRAKL